MFVAGACLGALFFSWLTHRFGRKKLFMITPGTYLVATTLTALSFAPYWFFLFRFLTGSGIGGEYAALNSAIDELIPSRHCGRIDIIINGTYWAGAAFGAILTVPATNDLPVGMGWRLCFGLGVMLGLVVRRNVPESARWLFNHGTRRRTHHDERTAQTRCRRSSRVRRGAVSQCVLRNAPCLVLLVPRRKPGLASPLPPWEPMGAVVPAPGGRGGRRTTDRRRDRPSSRR